MIHLGKVIIDAANIEFALKDYQEDGSCCISCSFMSGANLKVDLPEPLVDTVIKQIFDYKCALYELDGFIYEKESKSSPSPIEDGDKNKIIEVNFGKDNS